MNFFWGHCAKGGGGEDGDDHDDDDGGEQAEEVWGRISLPHCSRLRSLSYMYSSCSLYFSYSSHSCKLPALFCLSTVESSAGNVFRVAAASGLILAKTHR